MPPGFLLMQLFMLALPVGALGFFGWLGLRFVRARELESRRSLQATAQPGELARLQDAVLALEAEVHALRDRQEFVEKLLESRPAGGQLPPG